MATICSPPAGYPPEITGYAEPWIVSPGDQVSIKISSTEPEYQYQTVRIIQGVDLEHSPPKQEEIIATIPAGKAQGRFQLARPGSYAIVDRWIPGSCSKQLGRLGVSFYMQPWLPESGHTQTLVSALDVNRHVGFTAVILPTGTLEFWLGTGSEIEVVPTAFRPAKKRWVQVEMAVDGTDFTAAITPQARFAEAGLPPVTVKHQLRGSFAMLPDIPLLFGASYAQSPNAADSRPTNFFNGRLDSPCIKTNTTPLVKFDFSRDMTTDFIVDVSGHGHKGKLVNAPTRAVKGYDWDGTEPDWTRAKYGYGAIHFHDDDLDDAEWDTDFTITIPEDVRSGAYAVKVESTNKKTSDYIPFFVRAGQAAGQTQQREGKVAFVLSTLTYLAYANEHLFEREKRRSAIDVGPGFDTSSIWPSEDFERLKRRSDLGLSPYDVHNDDSGVVYSSAKRPILNLRPGYVMWAMARPREFSADSLFIGFLERERIPYEIVTDHDLHAQGVAAIAGFSTVVTGHHPEYPTLESYDAYMAYAAQGGNLMYLGGNGFYWVSSTDTATRPHRIEVRRGDQGVRTYGLPGGERVHSLSGQAGGMWRSRGRACNVLFAVGFSGEGAGPGVPFARTDVSAFKDASARASVAWMFEGIGPDELIGQHGLGRAGGASGDEVDRYDVANESPEAAIVLASSTGHSDEFGIAPEDTTFPIVNTLGTQTDLIRSDITYYVTSAGGGVFSVGSMNWFCSLGWDDYQNNVATLTRNVILGFLKGLR
ncbi:hypothetical protein A1O3_03289 [Capronia epimyces CBS 606.96]|uniref:N,N-dimethylformamidase beta subunit-like C-terminal domain-containing protein n=1 Tax=Capronia epimyces CBS 606.96 TaxID=1182542 RepID=W9Y1J1_9EURO|nr:uncharacterized protein A1O3_03289 [Capronia epimyces CBS 606.96]EXJ86338.1 hypothetical protein A1O3_03289 [Capronia epimyces CBS 606.96]